MIKQFVEGKDMHGVLGKGIMGDVVELWKASLRKGQ